MPPKITWDTLTVSPAKITCQDSYSCRDCTYYCWIMMLTSDMMHWRCAYVHKCIHAVRLTANAIDLPQTTGPCCVPCQPWCDSHNEHINARIPSALLLATSISLLSKSQNLHITVTEHESWMEEELREAESMRNVKGTTRSNRSYLLS